jgi:cysteinyl-tRNA synthetase
MDQGEETGTESLKEDRLDFAVWKARKPDEDTAWDSPWGPGRPGWHIECSAMAEKYLGPEFALHGGGADLVFPHHENEIAQTEAARGVPLARLWMHNGMVRVAEEKMAKSVGNIFQLAEALDEFAPETLVAYLISGHYRQPLEFSAEALREAEARVERIRNFLREDHPAGDPAAPGREAEEAAGLDSFVTARREQFLDALADDFNTPRALAALFELIAEGNKRPLPGAHAALEEMLPLVGLESLLEREAEADPESLELLAERERARAARDFERADRIRDELAQRGWDVRDAPEGARLVRRR